MKIKDKIGIALVALLTIISGTVSASDGKITVARAFYELAHQNNHRKIESLQHRGYSIESTDENGNNPICISILRNDKEAYKTLLNYGAKRNPSCMKNIPQEKYRHFFGANQETPVSKTYVSDVPYKLGAIAIGGGAIAAAVIFKGSTGGSSKNDSGNGDGGNDNNGGDGDGDNPTPPEPEKPEDCPSNSHYDKNKQQCVCNSGYGHFGDNSKCYAHIGNCKSQVKDKCNQCTEGYTLSGNKCYAPIQHCKKQEADKCMQCDNGYGTHGGDKTKCYEDIDKCQEQKEDKCINCIPGFGTHGDEKACYQNVDHCANQLQTLCKECMPGYDTYGDPYKCYSENPCKAYPHSIPVDFGSKCVCDERRGYTGDPYSVGCSQAIDGDYHEGDFVEEEWNNYNEKYCKSHGKYDQDSGICLCYKGYSGKDCSQCAENYLGFDGLCFRDLECKVEEHKVQVYSRCTCTAGYTEYYNEDQTFRCMKKIQCEKHYYQKNDSECACKPFFDENCDKCVEGFGYDPLMDECVRTEYKCEDHWTGDKCDICPPEFYLTPDGLTCGKQCAPNRLPIEENQDCKLCNEKEGYFWSQIANNCVKDECSLGTPGYIYRETSDGQQYCDCDTDRGYRRNKIGQCEFMETDLIGISDKNINNEEVIIENDGVMRDVYGMKPVVMDEDGKPMKDEIGNLVYFDNVYNAKGSSGETKGILHITNKNVGGNNVYGIYSKSGIYNSALMNSGNKGAKVTGEIIIEDITTSSDIFGIYQPIDADSKGKDTIYNSFAYANTQDETKNTSTGKIMITKDETSSGNIIGISANNNVFNAYTNTEYGVGSNVYAQGEINIDNKGLGNVIGIANNNSGARIYNSYAYLDSVVSDAVSQGIIKVKGKGRVIGISTRGTVSNSETQFAKSYNIIKNFSSHGLIDVESSSELSPTYGIYSTGSAGTRTTVYNAKGYNTNGIIKVNNTAGGTAYGIYSAQQTYQTPEDVAPIYNNTYNAFRSSAVYGDGIARGDIDINLSGMSMYNQKAVGIYAEGNIYNSYASSGSDVNLITEGNIKITDKSKTPMVDIRGIDSAGATIANAYNMGFNKNTTTEVRGNIDIKVGSNKNSVSRVAGIYTEKSNPQGAKVYNAALVNDKSKVTGTINVTADPMVHAPSNMYGIYAVSHEGEDSGMEIAQPKYVYNAYYENTEGQSGGTVVGEINVNASRDSFVDGAEYAGIHIENGEAYNAYNSGLNANVIGRINVTAYGGLTKAKVAGMSGRDAKLDNSGNSEINVKSTGNGMAYGMYGQDSYLYNDAKINVSADTSNAYGMYIERGTAINDKNGVINVSGKNGIYGIYAISDGTQNGKANVINNGKINITSEENGIGIYGKGTTTTIQNTGTITINGETCTGGDCNNGNAIVLENGATFENKGKMQTDGSFDFNEIGGNMVLCDSGKFIAKKEIKGDLKVSESVVRDTFEKQSIVENALSAQNIEDVNLISKSYMYTASTKDKGDNLYDVVMDMKDFSEITDNDKSGYLEANYAHNRNAEMYNILKGAQNVQEYADRESKLFGTAMLPNITQENLKIQRSLDRVMMNELFKEGNDVRKMVGADGVYIGRDDHGTLTGYDMNSQTMYSLYDKKLNNNYRLGLGLSLTHTDTDYNDDSRRKSFMVQGYVPVTYTNNKGLTAVTIARLGYADGDYDRRGYEKTYKADTTDITYGLSNELRYKMNVKGVNITPFIGLNAMGWYQDEIEEHGGSQALTIASEHIFSLESALGLYLDKDINFAEDNKLNVALGVGYYHEFADPYSGVMATNGNSLGQYKLRDEEHLNSRNRGMISAKVNYDYKDFSLYGELLQYLEKEYPIKVDMGVKYKF